MLYRSGGERELVLLDESFLLSTLPDGWRCLAVLDDRVRLRARSGRDLAPLLPAIATALAGLRPARSDGPTILDGILVLPSAADQAWPGLRDVAAFAVLDALAIAGRDLTGRPLQERQERLRALRWPDEGLLRLVPAWRGDARATLAQLQGAGTLAAGTLLARRASSPYRPGRRGADWIAFGEQPRCEMLLCGIAASGALVLGMPSPLGIVPGGVTWPTRRWRTLAQRCGEGAAPFAASTLWPSLGAVSWARPEVWLAVTPDVRPGSGRGGPRWRLLRVQEDLSSPAPLAEAPR